MRPSVDRNEAARESESRVSAVRARGIVKEFGVGATRTRVLHGIDADFEAGTITYIVGPSGCGKTTLISIIAGILSAEAGEVEVFGTPLASLKGASLPRFRAETMGFIFQQFNLLPALTAAENASVPLLIRGVREAAALGAAEELLAAVGLEAHLNKYPEELSGGQQQRVAIARALVHSPRLVISDEPTASLDGDAGRSIMQLLREHALRADRALIVVTHDTRIFSFADRILRMADGRMTDVELPPFGEPH
jgi:putative ABC transport system ATP-binding protein